jgi:penicillin amidase
LTGEGATANLLPPEFYLLGISEIEPWTPLDSLSMVKLMNFHLTWNWNQELYRDILENTSEDLKLLVDEIFPYYSEYSHELVTILTDEDLK